jgi:TDG/mug DNA glycosylase family protein
VAPKTTIVLATRSSGLAGLVMSAMIRPVDRKTVGVYETRAPEWRDARPARFVERAESLARSALPGGVRVDLGCGAGKHLPHLGRPVVALDAAFAMLELARELAPDVWCMQADLEALPFRRGALAAAWARASYLHVPKAWLPWALAELHQSLAVDAPIDLTMRAGDAEGPLADDDFPGRFFAEWQPEALGTVVVGAGFSIEELMLQPTGREWLHVRGRRARTLPDFVGPDLRVLLVGLNPSEYAADAGVGFARPGNRFWPAALAAGLVARDRDPRYALRVDGVGMTDLVKRVTVSASALTVSEYRDGAARVEGLVRWLHPRLVCFVGLAGYRAAVHATATAGVPPAAFGGAPTYVMPNPSGANAHTSPAKFAEHLRTVRALADADRRP